MRMTANVMGEENFKRAVLELLANNRHSVINTNMFLAHLDQYASDVLLPDDKLISDVLQKWSHSVPAKNVLRVGNKTDKFELNYNSGEYVDLPVDYFTPTLERASQPKLWVLPAIYQDAPQLDLEPWIAVNPDQYGLYQVNYADHMWAALAIQLRKNHTQFNRAQLISDSITMDLSFWLRYHFDIIRYLPNETNALTWKAARHSYEAVALLMRGYENIYPFYAYYNNLTREIYWENRIGREMENFELTLEVSKIACYSGHPECVTDVEDYYVEAVQTEAGLLGSKDFRTFVYCTLAKHSLNKRSIVDHVAQLWAEDRSVHAKSRAAIQGVACTGEEDLVIR